MKFNGLKHQKIIDILIEAGFDKVILVGNEFGKTDHCYEWYATSSMLAEKLKKEPINGNMILLKGSHGIGLQKIIELL